MKVKQGSVILLSPVVLVLAVCGGVAQEDYDRINGDLGEAQNEITDLKAAQDELSTNLAEAQSQMASLQIESEKLATDLTEANGQADQLERELNGLLQQREEANNLAQILGDFMDIGLSESDVAGAQMMEVLGRLAEVTDPALRAKWEAVLEAQGLEADRAAEEFVERLIHNLAGLLK